jgi:quinohemoprotein ethanol dehydrogenase
MIKYLMPGVVLALTTAFSSCHAMGGSSMTEADKSKQIERGAKLYNQSCYKCHGPQAVSGGTVPDLRMFAGGKAEFVSTVQAGRPGTIMPAWAEFLSEEEISSIYAYVRSRAP